MKKNVMLSLMGTFMLLSAFSCGGSSKAAGTSGESGSEVETVNVPPFNADSAYRFVEEQVNFGPRVPNTQGHVACGNYLAARLEAYGAKVTSQYADLVAHGGILLKARNIIGAYKPESKKRIALFAHWDTRPWADNDPDEKNHRTPILGANDGASGVGVLLEIARQLSLQQPELGIDLIFLDAEDYGSHDADDSETSWCLGAQYWGQNPHVQPYNARFGILLDMVGGKNTTFLKEAYSEQYARDVNRKVWKAAKRAGYGNYFIDEDGGGVTDDHLFINRLARIKTIDIIASGPDGGFPSTWHTLSDNMEHIDRNTLKAVGQTVLEVIYNEK